MGDHDHGALGRAQRIDAGRHGAQGVDIEAGIGLIENGEARLQHGHLENLVALFLAAGETGVDGAVQQHLVHIEELHTVLDQGEEVHGIQLLEAAVLADGIQRGFQEVHVADAGDLDGILERQKNAFARAIFGRHGQQVLAAIDHLAAGDDVQLAPCQHLRQRAFAGAVRPHDGVDLAGINGEIDALQNFPIANRGVQILDF